jgi:hypothetical protein
MSSTSTGPAVWQVGVPQPQHKEKYKEKYKAKYMEKYQEKYKDAFRFPHCSAVKDARPCTQVPDKYKGSTGTQHVYKRGPVSCRTHSQMVKASY